MADNILVEWEVYLIRSSKGSKEIHERGKRKWTKKKEAVNTE